MLFISYPLAAVLRHIPSKDFKHLFSGLVGVAMLQWMYGEDWIHAAISSAVAYIFSLIAPAKSMPMVIFIWAMAYMTGIFDILYISFSAFTLNSNKQIFN